MSKSARVVLCLCLAVMVGAVVVLAGCPRPVEDAVGPGIGPRPPSTAPSGEPYKIGAIFSVTGGGAPLGEPGKLAAEMVEKQINDAGGINGRPLQIIIEDDANEESKAVLAAKKLIEQDGVMAIVGPTMSGPTLAIIDTVQKAEIPLFSCAASAKITDPVKPWVFSSAQTDVLAVQRILAYLKDQNLTRVAIICDANAFGQSGAEQLKLQLPAAGVQVVEEEKFGNKDTDMTAQLTKIRAKDPQAIICWGTNPGPAVVAKNMKALGIEAQLIQSHGVANMKFIELAGDAAEGLILPAGKLLVLDELEDSDPQKAVLAQFKQDYEAATSRPVDTFAGHAFDSLMMIIEALKAGADSPVALRDALEHTQGHVGIGGVFNLSATDHNGLDQDAFALVRIVDGGWQMVR